MFIYFIFLELRLLQSGIELTEMALYKFLYYYYYYYYYRIFFTQW